MSRKYGTRIQVSSFSGGVYSFIYLFIYLFICSSKNVYGHHLPGAEEIVGSQTHMVPALMEWIVYMRGVDNYKEMIQ